MCQILYEVLEIVMNNTKTIPALREHAARINEIALSTIKHCTGLIILYFSSPNKTVSLFTPDVFISLSLYP